MVNAPGRYDDEKESARPPGTVLDPSDRSNPCLICASSRRVVRYPFDARDVVQCIDCGFTYAHPMPPPGFFDDVYEGAYWTEYNLSVGEPDIHDRIAEFLTVSNERVELLQRFKATGRLLDVGCSMGFLVKAASDAGFEARGIDLSDETLFEGIDRFGVDLSKAHVRDLPRDRRYDAITCYNTIEHVVGAQEFLAEMAARLAPNGILVVGTHDIECETHRREKRLWKHIMPTEHVYYFRKRDLIEIGRRVGLRVIHSDKPIDNLIVVYYVAGNS